MGKNIKIGILILPGFPMACLTSMIEPMRAANEISETDTFSWKLISESGARVRSSAAVWFEPDLALSDVEDLHHLYLLSAPSSTFDAPVASNGKLRKLERHGMMMGAISGGIFPLARSGLLHNHMTSVHWCYAAAFEAEFPELDKTDEVIALDRRRATASGAAAAFELALHMIEDALGPEVATEVACWFQHPLVRGEGVTQKVPTANSVSTDDMLPQVVQDAVVLFNNHIEDPINVADVADAIGMSVRQLERMFKKSTGQSPHHYYRAVRMKAARQLVLYSKDSMKDIALAVGYASTATLSQNYEDVFGVRPTIDREKINLFRVRDNAAVPSI
jgi:transcriptional regulator GlxA family with amidase domain